MIQVKVEDGGAVELTGPAEIEIVGMRGRRFVLRIHSMQSVKVLDSSGEIEYDGSGRCEPV